MSGNNRKQDDDDNELIIKINEGINDDIDSDDNNNDDEEIDEHEDEDYESVENMEDNRPGESNSSDGNGNDGEGDENEYVEDDDSSDVISRDDRRLQQAIRDGKSVNYILKLIELFPIDVQHKDIVGDYPLHTALACGNNNIAMKLIEVFPEAAQYKSYSGQYPLHLAIKNYSCTLGDDVVMKLIEIFPIAVTESTFYGTVLHFACYRNRSETIIKKLIEINPQAIQEKNNDKGRYPIEYAIECKAYANTEITKLLLDGDPIGITRQYKTHLSEGTSLLHLACKSEDADFVEYLVQRSDLQINVRDNDGKTPLHYACLYQDKIVDMVLNHPDIDINAADCLNDTPLHKVLKYNVHPERRVDVVQKLLNHPFIFINQKNNLGKTPLDVHKERRNFFLPQELKLQCSKEILNLFRDFTIKRRWQALCYHLNEISEL